MANDNAVKVEMLVMYKECMHNHAASTRGFLLDGCGLFETPSGTTTGSREAMFCAVCGCHRNFHQRHHHHHRFGGGSGRGTMIIRREPASAPGRFAPEQAAARRQRRALPRHTEGTSAAPQEVPLQHGVGAPRRKRITRAQSEMVRALTERNNRKMFREYSQTEVLHIRFRNHYTGAQKRHLSTKTKKKSCNSCNRSTL
ncbi:hypothetical protein MIMGU_mgv1a023014mg, partial [Erythranthe guttata]